jgi:hypothetical protein
VRHITELRGMKISGSDNGRDVAKDVGRIIFEMKISVFWNAMECSPL